MENIAITYIELTVGSSFLGDSNWLYVVSINGEYIN